MKPRIFIGVVTITTLFTLTSPQLVLAQSASASAPVQEQPSSDVAPVLDALDSGLERFVEPQAQSVTPQLEGVTIKEPVSAPSRFGLFFRGIKEQISLITTVNPVKKAEKQLQFAEERIKIAERIAESSDNPAAQEKAAQMIEKANVYIEKIADKQERWLEKKDERVDRLIKNIATHQVRREEALSRIEEKLPEGLIQKMESRREEILEKNKQLLEAIPEADIPEEVREHLKEAKKRISIHAEEAKEFHQKNAELLKQAAQGNEEAQKQLESLRGERRDSIEEQTKRQRMIDEFMVKKNELELKSQAGDDVAKKQLDQMDAFQRQMENMQREFEKDRPEAFGGHPPFPPEGGMPMGREDFFGANGTEEGNFDDRPMDSAALERRENFTEELREKVLQGDQEAGRLLEQMGRGREGQAPFDPTKFGPNARPTFNQPFDKNDLEKRAKEGNSEAEGLLRKINREQEKLNDISKEESNRLRARDAEEMKKTGIQPGMPRQKQPARSGKPNEGPEYAPMKAHQRSPEDIGYKPNTEFYTNPNLSKEEVQWRQKEEVRKFEEVRDQAPAPQFPKNDTFKPEPGFQPGGEMKFQGPEPMRQPEPNPSFDSAPRFEAVPQPPFQQAPSLQTAPVPR